jgi:hypothetical protein
MKKILFLLTIFYLFNFSYAQDSLNIKNQKKIEKKLPKENVEILNNISSQKNINHSGEINLKSNNQSLFEFLFPSLIAIFIGGLAFSATLITSKRQLKSNKESLERQINSSLEIAKLDFRKNVLSDNRQSWINELRELISELISLINLHLIDPNNINSEDAKRINFLIVKSEFMLNPIKDLEYINSIRDLKNLIFDLSREKITYESSQEKIELLKENTKKTLKTEWERVKNGE